MQSPKQLRALLVVLLIATLSVEIAGNTSSVLAWGRPQSLAGIPSNVYRPRIAAEANRVHVVWQQADSNQLYYSRGITTASGGVRWENPCRLARNVNEAQSDWDVAADATGTVHVVYGASGRIWYLRNTSGGGCSGWSSATSAASPDGRINGMELALDAGFAPYVVWDEGVDPSTVTFAFRTSGGSWITRNTGIDVYLARNPVIAVSNGGDTATVHIMSEVKARKTDTAFSVRYSRGTRGGNISNRNFSQAFAGAGDRPTITIDRATDTLYTGFVAGSISDGYDLKFTYSENNGQSWSRASSLAVSSSLWADKTPMVADGGIAYLMLPGKRWTGDVIAAVGFYDIQFRLGNKSFSSPKAIRNVSGADYKNVAPDYAINALTKVGVWISGFISDILYNADPGGISGVAPVGPSGSLVLNDGASVTNNATVNVRINNARGNPTSMRVAIDGDPTPDTPLQPFVSQFDLALPPSTACQRSVAVVLVNDFGLESTVLRSTITVDLQVQARTLTRNPFLPGNTGAFPASVGVQQVVGNGDPAYTRVPAVYARVDNLGECSGLTQLRVGRDQSKLDAAYGIDASTFANPIALPNPVNIGPNAFAVQLEDNAGNRDTSAWSIIYDPVPPTLVVSGTLNVITPTTGANVLARLNFTGNVVSDNLYPGRGFWGVWLANSRTPITNPLTNTGLLWYPVAAPGNSSDFALTWDLLTGLPAQSQTPGDYYVYVRFLDGAGNLTDGVLEAKTTLPEIIKPTLYFPVITR